MRRNLFFVILLLFIHWNAGHPIYLENIKNDCPKKADYSNFVGSNLFDGFRKECFSPEDINLLVARKEFEKMIPNEYPPDLLEDNDVKHILIYFYYGFRVFEHLEHCKSRRFIEKAFYDTLGGFMQYYLVPVAKFSYYASKVELRTVRNVLILYQKCKVFLNTNGNGWRIPMKDPLNELKSVYIDPLLISHEKSFNNEICCSDLDLSIVPENDDDHMIVPLPKIEHANGNGELGNIWIPFSQKRTYNLKSCKSAFILVKFYRSVSRCYVKKSLPQDHFDQKFRRWIFRNVKAHLSDEQFYPGLGGILNIYENTRLNADDDEEEPRKSRRRIELNKLPDKGGFVSKVFNEFLDGFTVRNSREECVTTTLLCTPTTVRSTTQSNECKQSTNAPIDPSVKTNSNECTQSTNAPIDPCEKTNSESIEKSKTNKTISGNVAPRKPVRKWSIKMIIFLVFLFLVGLFVLCYKIRELQSKRKMKLLRPARNFKPTYSEIVAANTKIEEPKTKTKTKGSSKSKKDEKKGSKKDGKSSPKKSKESKKKGKEKPEKKKTDKKKTEKKKPEKKKPEKKMKKSAISPKSPKSTKTDSSNSSHPPYIF